MQAVSVGMNLILLMYICVLFVVLILVLCSIDGCAYTVKSEHTQNTSVVLLV